MPKVWKSGENWAHVTSRCSERRERFTIGLRTLDSSPKRKRVHAFREFTRLRFGLVGVCLVSSCAQPNREALYPESRWV
jgi:hypothetical protein